MMDLQLYPHQQEAMRQFRAAFLQAKQRPDYPEKGRRVVFTAACGFGKSVFMAEIARGAAARGTATMIIVDRRELVHQLSATLNRYGIDHGVIMAKAMRVRPDELIQICSAQTLEAMGRFPDCKLILADEAHALRQDFIDKVTARPELDIGGVTATPLTPGMSQIYWDGNVCPFTTDWMINEGHLVRPTVYAAQEIDMKGVKVVAGEWNQKETTERALRVIGDMLIEVPKMAMKHFGKPMVKSLFWVVNVDHGKEVCKGFQELGFNVVQVSYKDGNDDKRRAIIEEFRKPDSVIDGLVAVDIFSRGFDVPDVLMGVDARPLRKSLTTHIQKIGRIMRTSPGKTEALWLCHSGNYLRFKDDLDRLFHEGYELDNGALEDKKRPLLDDEQKDLLRCVACGMVLPRMADSCPGCGRMRRRKPVDQVAGTMVLVGNEMVPAIGLRAYLKDKVSIWRQLCFMGLQRKGNPDAAGKWAAGRFKGLYGHWPKGMYLPKTQPETPCAELISKVKADSIRYAKGMRNAGR